MKSTYLPIRLFLVASLTVAFTLVLTATLSLTGCNHSDDEPITVWPTDNNCDLHSQSCTVQQGKASVTLKISPHPLPIARPLGIEVSISHLEVKSIELDISGINMYMGYNRVALSDQGNGRYVGTSMLAFCTSQKMQWQITLMIHKKDGSQIQIPYRLETVNRP